MKTITAVLAAGVMLCGATGVAAAQPQFNGGLDSAEATYIDNAYAAICGVLDNHPNEDGVYGVAAGILQAGFSLENAADIINGAVWLYCPRHWALLNSVNDSVNDGPLKRAQ